MTQLVPFSSIDEAVEEILETIPSILPFDLNSPLKEDATNRMIKARIIEEWVSLTQVFQHPSQSTGLKQEICKFILRLMEDVEIIDLDASHEMSNYLVRLDYENPTSWFEKGKVMFQLFVSHKYDSIDSIIEIFEKVVELGLESENEEYKITTFWGYFYLGNIYLYKLLTGEEALERALKYYNQGYRYAKTENLDIDEEYIFDSVEIIQRILMNQFPLLLVIYNESGMLLYNYLFQFVEVMSQDQRFIPNFTALLSAVDEHINELFRSPVTSSYLVMKNRLLVLSTIHDQDGRWVKVAMIFSYLQQSAFNVEIDTTLLTKVNSFVSSIINNEDVISYLIGFYGRRHVEIEDAIDNILMEVFSEDIE